MFFTNIQGKHIVLAIIDAIQRNKEYLSDIDGAIGDGDHGINMNKGAAIAKEQLSKDETMSQGFKTLSMVLMNKIGGSMGPLYGSIFMGMQIASQGKELIDGEVMQAMLTTAYDSIKMISPAKPNDKTLVDVLDPSVRAYQAVYKESNDMKQALLACRDAACKGMAATINMQARLGRAARLGEKSIGHQDAGATSCCIILCALCDEAIALFDDQKEDTNAKIC